MAPGPEDRALETFRRGGGRLRTKEALSLGIHPRTLYGLRDGGRIVRVSRGIYQLADHAPYAHPDLVTVALRVPRAVLCLVSALAFHDATSEIPHEVQIALPRATKTPRLDFPPIRVFRFSGPGLSEGIEMVKVDGVDLRVYGLAKTVVDCFRFRNKLGLDVALDAMSQAMRRGGVRPAQILHYARLCRIESVLLPYLEAMR